MTESCDILNSGYHSGTCRPTAPRDRRTVWLVLGANLGDRVATLREAVLAIAGTVGIRVLQVSGVYETPPWGYIDQPRFYNLALAIETVLAPLELLETVKRLETSLGREEGPRWGPRVIDIDLILWDGLTVRHERLELPHPRYRERAFVLWPLREIAPGVKDPVTGRSIAQMAGDLENTPDAANIRRLGTLEQVS
ncbi:MAG TPA: 2-amino-4-hydroxy-6-hydroxymethyldihydropteridine diphosphokinase [Candidatus Hydrogenedentes bacterium]|nr:2-amino-4-hydroxy-6-hydroxymethyldihydropteridine diphosphokinase [Candidatus Hydrogenedentota bacterium]